MKEKKIAMEDKKIIFEKLTVKEVEKIRGSGEFPNSLCGPLREYFLAKE